MAHVIQTKGGQIMTKKYYISFFRPFAFAYLWWTVIIAVALIVNPTIYSFVGFSVAGIVFIGLFVFIFIRMAPIKINKDGLVVKRNSFTIQWETIPWDEIEQAETELYAFVRFIKISYKNKNGTQSRLIPLSVHKKDKFIEALLKYIPNDENPLKALLITGDRPTNRNRLLYKKTDSLESVEQAPFQEEGKKGIGGLLILVAIGRILSPISATIMINKSLKTLLIDLQQTPIPNLGLWKRAFMFEFFTNVVLLLFGIILLILFFWKEKSF